MKRMKQNRGCDAKEAQQKNRNHGNEVPGPRNNKLITKLSESPSKVRFGMPFASTRNERGNLPLPPQAPILFLLLFVGLRFDDMTATLRVERARIHYRDTDIDFAISGLNHTMILQSYNML